MGLKGRAMERLLLTPSEAAKALIKADSLDEALDRIEDILAASDALWLCRGDLGAEVVLLEKVPRNIIQKNGSLSDEEWTLMRSHPERGGKLLLSAPDVSEAASYGAAVLEVADRENDLRASVDGYVLEVGGGG